MKLRDAWIALNVLGVSGFLYLSSRTWPTAGDHVYWAGDAFYVAVVIVSLLLCYIILNTTALIVILRRADQTKHTSAIKLWIGVAIVWLLVVGSDLWMLRRIPLTDGSEISAILKPNQAFKPTLLKSGNAA